MKTMTLNEDIRRTYDAALGSGKLLFTETQVEYSTEENVEFQVRTIPSLGNKTVRIKKKEEKEGNRTNPFLPYDPDLFVREFDKHVVLLNKYCVCKDHVLVVTKDFQSQDDPVRPADFAAVWRCMAEVRERDFLAFYNCGSLSGASQPHKHVQLIPMSENGGCSSTPPVMKLIRRKAEQPGRIFQLPEYKFVHGCVMLDRDRLSSERTTEETSEYLAGQYGGLLGHMFDAIYEYRARRPDEATGLGRGRISYNLVFTGEFMLVVPRIAERNACGVSVNSLGYAGMVLVRSNEEKEEVRRNGGFLRLIESLAYPIEESGSEMTDPAV